MLGRTDTGPWHLDTKPCAKGCFQSTPRDSGRNEICLYWMHEIKSVSKIPGTASFEQSKPKWRCLAVIHSTTFGKTSTSRRSGGVVMIRACFAENCNANFCGTTLRSCVNECLRHWIKFWRRLSQNFSKISPADVRDYMKGNYFKLLLPNYWITRCTSFFTWL